MTQRNTEARTAMLAARRLRQRSREPGFTDMPSKQINATMQGMHVMVTLEWLATKRTPVEIEIQKEAFDRVRKQLPQAPTSRLFRRRPSKNDDAAYRGEGGLGLRRLAAMAPPQPAKRVRKPKVAAL